MGLGKAEILLESRSDGKRTRDWNAYSKNTRGGTAAFSVLS